MAIAIQTSKQPWVRRPLGPPIINLSHPSAFGLKWVVDIGSTVSTPERGLASGPQVTVNTGTRLRYDHGIESLVRGFGSTYGSGTTDRASASFNWPTNFSVVVWAYKNGDGGGSGGRIIEQDPTTKATLLNNASGLLLFMRTTSGNAGQWSFGTIPTGRWACLGVSEVGTAQPIGYIDGVATAGTELSAPSGSATTTTYTHSLGNRASDGARVWDGMLGLLCIWDRVLSGDEFLALYDPRTRWELYAAG